MTDRPYPQAFSTAAMLASPRPLSDLLERRAPSDSPGWLAGSTPATAPRGPVAVAEPEPEPEPEPEVAAAPPPPPPPDPTVTARMAEAIQALGAAEANLAAEPDVVELAMTIAQAVLHHELQTQPQLVVEAVHSGLVALRGDAPTKIRVHPSMLDALRAARPDLEADGVEMLADPRLDAGGCIVESAHHALDASIEGRLERFRGAFEASLKGEG